MESPSSSEQPRPAFLLPTPAAIDLLFVHNETVQVTDPNGPVLRTVAALREYVGRLFTINDTYHEFNAQDPMTFPTILGNHHVVLLLHAGVPRLLINGDSLLLSSSVTLTQ